MAACYTPLAVQFLWELTEAEKPEIRLRALLGILKLGLPGSQSVRSRRPATARRAQEEELTMTVENVESLIRLAQAKREVLTGDHNEKQANAEVGTASGALGAGAAPAK